MREATWQSQNLSPSPFWATIIKNRNHYITKYKFHDRLKELGIHIKTYVGILQMHP
jgi:hypothetical protein